MVSRGTKSRVGWREDAEDHLQSQRRRHPRLQRARSLRHRSQTNKKRKIDEEEEEGEAEKDDADLIKGEEDTAIKPVVKDKDDQSLPNGDRNQCDALRDQHVLRLGLL
jgi:hypothetical protein